MSNNDTKIKVTLDTSDIQRQIDEISKKYSVTVKIGKLDTSGIEKQMSNSGSSAAKEFAKNFNIEKILSYNKNIGKDKMFSF